MQFLSFELFICLNRGFASACFAGGGAARRSWGLRRLGSGRVAREGARVTIADINEEAGNATASQLNELGPGGLLVLADLANSTECQRVVTDTVAAFGGVDILFNNVGILGPGSVVDVEEEVWDRVIDVNLKSMMLTSKYAIPKMIEAGEGSIVNLSSIVGLRAGSFTASHPYATSKGGIIGLSNSMAVHYGRDNIRVNCLAPGHIRSPMVARQAHNATEEILDMRRKAGPLGTEGTGHLLLLNRIHPRQTTNWRVELDRLRAFLTALKLVLQITALDQ